MEFYNSLFATEMCSHECQRELHEGLSLLSLEEKAALGSELALEELTKVVNPMGSGEVPGIDGCYGICMKPCWSAINRCSPGVLPANSLLSVA